MNSSGIKRGLAATAVSALAVAGLPFLASTASATTNASTLGATAVELYGPSATAWVSTKNDGTNTSVSLVAGGGDSVVSVLFQYTTTSGGAGNWIDVPAGLVSRNADGVFQMDWTNPPADLTAIQAVGSTGTTDGQTVGLTSAAQASTTDTVELASEGALGVFIAPYAGGDAGDDTQNGQYIGVRGTTSGVATGVTVSHVSHEAQTATDTATATAFDADGAAGAGTTGAFGAIMDLTGYTASTGGDPNQLVLNAATTTGTQNTDDAEASTLRNQTITTVTATPETQNAPGNADVTVKVVDQFGQPVAGAQVATFRPDDASDGDTNPQDPGTVKGYTDAFGELVVSQPNNVGTVTYFANTTNENDYQAGTDPSDTASVTGYTPVTSQVLIKSRAGRIVFDIDELAEGGDEFTIETRDQNGALFNEDGNATDNDSATEVEYRWIIDSSLPGEATMTQAWQTNAADSGSVFTVPALTDASLATFTADPGTGAPVTELPAGTYRLEARRPNAGLGGGLVNATPATYGAGEAEVTFTEGTSANATAGGSTTITGNLAIVGAPAGLGNLGGREVPLTYTPAGLGNAGFAPQSEQPAGTTRTSGTAAVAVTDASGNFSVKINDVPFPSNVTPTPETGTLAAGPAEESATDTTTLQGINGRGAAADDSDAMTGTPYVGANAAASLAVNFINAAEVGRIAVTANTLDPRDSGNATSTAQPGPGVPVDLDIVVYAKDNDTNPANDVPISDANVEISTDHGFLSPNAETSAAAVLASGHTTEGSAFGYYQNDGVTKTVSTGDAAAAGAVVAIERDSGFDDNNTVDTTVTVKSGAITTTVPITFNANVLLNAGEVSLVRADGGTGDVEVGEEVGFNLFVKDQFGNLVAGELANVSDDATSADFATDGDFDTTQSDNSTSGVGIVAFAQSAGAQTLMASLQPGSVKVGPAPASDPVNNVATTASATSAPLNWVAAPPVKVDPNIQLSGKGKGKDKITVNADSVAAGATVTLWVKGDKKKTGTLDADGDFTFTIKDKNGKKGTKYVVKVAGTSDTTKAQKSITVK